MILSTRGGHGATHTECAGREDRRIPRMRVCRAKCDLGVASQDRIKNPTGTHRGVDRVEPRWSLRCLGPSVGFAG